MSLVGRFSVSIDKGERPHSAWKIALAILLAALLLGGGLAVWQHFSTAERWPVLDSRPY